MAGMGTTGPGGGFRGTKRTRRGVAALVGAAVVTALGLAPSALAKDEKLPTDPRVVEGTLPSGMRYMVMRHSNPPGRVGMFMHVSAGSLNETDKQRGLAHYLEHMAFNGSEHFEPNSVIHFFQSMGMQFGQDQNAFTSFDQTTYQLYLPDTKPETLDKGMLFFADVGQRLKLLPHEIEEERNIILEERRTRLGANERISNYVLERIAPGSLFGLRLPIGTEESIKTVAEQDFRDYYSKYYVPSNMTLMVVADEDPAKVVAHIEKNFAYEGVKATPIPADQDARITPTSETFAIVAHDPELSEASISINRVMSPRDPADTMSELREEMVDSLAAQAFNRRMSAKMNEGNTAYLGVRASDSELANTLRWTTVSADGKPEDWKTLLSELGTDLQRARLHGFSERELDDMKRAMIAGAEQAVERESTMPAAVVLRRLNSSVAEGEPFMSAQQTLDAFKAILPTISAKEISASFAKNFDPSKVVFIAELPSSTPDLPSETQLVDLGTKAVGVKPEKMEETDRPTELLAKKPEPGKIASETTHEASKVSTAVFANGVTVRHRFMDIRKDQVQVTINLAAGGIQETATNRGIAEVAGLAWNRPATSTLTATNVRDLMTGKKVSVGGGAGDDTMTLSISGSPSDLETGFQLAHLLLTDPKIEAAAFDQWKRATLQEITDRKTSPDAAFGVYVNETIYPSSEARMQLITEQQVNAMSVEAAQKWLRNAITTAPIEVSIVGDVQKDQAMKLAAQYLGSLPKREAMSAKTLDELRMVKRPAHAIKGDTTFKTETVKSYVLSGFFGPDPENIADTRTMQAAARILSTRMIDRVREGEQLAYSPRVGMSGSFEYPEYSMFLMQTTTDPEKTRRLIEVMDEMFADFAKSGPTEEELVTFKLQFAKMLEEQMRQPSPLWTGQTASLSYRNRTIDDILAMENFYQDLTAEQIKTVFAKYYKPESVIQVSMRPEGDASPASATPKAGGGKAPGGHSHSHGHGHGHGDAGGGGDGGVGGF